MHVILFTHKKSIVTIFLTMSPSLLMNLKGTRGIFQHYISLHVLFVYICVLGLFWKQHIRMHIYCGCADTGTVTHRRDWPAQPAEQVVQLTGGASYTWRALQDPITRNDHAHQLAPRLNHDEVLDCFARPEFGRAGCNGFPCRASGVEPAKIENAHGGEFGGGRA